jgi:hypothetical protein
VRCGIALVLVFGVVGCKSVGVGAREEFGRQYSCPDDRVTARERPDIAPETVLDPMRTRAAAPPPEVAADPGRLAKWQADRDAALAARKHMYDDYEIHEVSGCDHTQLMACHHPISRSGGAQIANVSCQIVTLPTGP